MTLPQPPNQDVRAASRRRRAIPSTGAPTSSTTRRRCSRNWSASSTSATAAAAASASATPSRPCSTPSTNPTRWKSTASPKKDYWDVVDHCYLCDMCYMTKCPYVPPHEWNVDFPHLMLRAKAARFKEQGAPREARQVLSATDDRSATSPAFPVVVNAVNAVNRSKRRPQAAGKTLGVHRDAPVPEYHSKTARKRASRRARRPGQRQGRSVTTGKVALFTTCYGNRNQPDVNEDLIAVFEHNGIAVTLASKEACCGMPKLELGDLESVRKPRTRISPCSALVDEGWDIVTPIPSCTLMFKQELPLMFPDDADVIKVPDAMFDPFEYLMLRHKDGLLKTDFKNPLGKVSYQVPCHLRVQNIGLKTRDMLQLVPDTRSRPSSAARATTAPTPSRRSSTTCRRRSRGRSSTSSRRPTPIISSATARWRQSRSPGRRRPRSQ